MVQINRIEPFTFALFYGFIRHIIIRALIKFKYLNAYMYHCVSQSKTSTCYRIYATMKISKHRNLKEELHFQGNQSFDK